MITVLIGREYNVYEQLEMDMWCNEYCQDIYYKGCPTVEEYHGHEMCFSRKSEVPWRFKNDEDACLFKLRWL